MAGAWSRPPRDHWCVQSKELQILFGPGSKHVRMTPDRVRPAAPRIDVAQRPTQMPASHNRTIRATLAPQREDARSAVHVVKNLIK